MTKSYFEDLEDIKYIEEHENLLSKFYLPVLDTLEILSKKKSECILTLKEIHKITKHSQILIEDIKPVIANLKFLKKRLNVYLSEKDSLINLEKILMNISETSQQLILSKKYLSDVDLGWFGASDTVREGQFEYDYLYYFSENNFGYLLKYIKDLILLFETKGITEKPLDKSYDAFIDDLHSLIKIIIHISPKYIPNILMIEKPKIFVTCNNLGKKLERYTRSIENTYLLIDQLDLIDKTIEGLVELVEKYKDKPRKKIKLDTIFFTKDGAEVLNKFLNKTKKYV